MSARWFTRFSVTSLWSLNSLTEVVRRKNLRYSWTNTDPPVNPPGEKSVLSFSIPYHITFQWHNKVEWKIFCCIDRRRRAIRIAISTQLYKNMFFEVMPCPKDDSFKPICQNFKAEFDDKWEPFWQSVRPNFKFWKLVTRNLRQAIWKYLLLPKVTKIKGHCAGISMALFRTLLFVPNKVTGCRPRWRERWFVIYYGSDHTDFTPVPLIAQSGGLADLSADMTWSYPTVVASAASTVYFLLFAQVLYWSGPAFNEIVLRPHF